MNKTINMFFAESAGRADLVSGVSQGSCDVLKAAELHVESEQNIEVF